MSGQSIPKVRRSHSVSLSTQADNATAVGNKKITSINVSKAGVLFAGDKFERRAARYDNLKNSLSEQYFRGDADKADVFLARLKAQAKKEVNVAAFSQDLEAGELSYKALSDEKTLQFLNEQLKAFKTVCSAHLGASFPAQAFYTYLGGGKAPSSDQSADSSDQAKFLDRFNEIFLSEEGVDDSDDAPPFHEELEKHAKAFIAREKANPDSEIGKEINKREADFKGWLEEKKPDYSFEGMVECLGERLSGDKMRLAREIRVGFYPATHECNAHYTAAISDALRNYKETS